MPGYLSPFSPTSHSVIAMSCVMNILYSYAPATVDMTLFLTVLGNYPLNGVVFKTRTHSGDITLLFKKVILK